MDAFLICMRFSEFRRLGAVQNLHDLGRTSCVGSVLCIQILHAQPFAKAGKDLEDISVHDLDDIFVDDLDDISVDDLDDIFVDDQDDISVDELDDISVDDLDDISVDDLDYLCVDDLDYLCVDNLDLNDLSVDDLNDLSGHVKRFFPVEMHVSPLRQLRVLVALSGPSFCHPEKKTNNTMTSQRNSRLL